MMESKDSLNQCVTSAWKDGITSIAFQQKRKMLTSESSPVLLNYEHEQNNFDYPRQTVELIVNPDLAEEYNVIDDSDIFVIIANKTATSDTIEVDEADNSTNNIIANY